MEAKTYGLRNRHSDHIWSMEEWLSFPVIQRN